MKEKTKKGDDIANSDWSGWQSKAALDHQINTILEMTTPTDRLKWLVEMLEGLEKLGLFTKPKV